MEIGLDNVLKTGENDIGNYGRGLAIFPQQNGKQGQEAGKGGQNGSEGQMAENLSGGAAIGANTLSHKNGIMNMDDLRKLSGWREEFVGGTLKNAEECLNAFHQSMEETVSISDISAVQDAGEKYDKLVDAVNKYVNRARRKGSLFRRKEDNAMLSAMSSLLIRLYSMGNVFEHRENLVYDYLMENNLETARLGDIVTGRGAMSVQGNMVNTGISSGQIDKTAEQMKKRKAEKKGEKREKADTLRELKYRRLPALGDKNALEELQLIAKMLEDIELQVDDNMDRENIRVLFFDVTKMVHTILRYPSLIMNADSTARIPMGMTSREDDDLSLTSEYYKAAAGKTIGEASVIINGIRRSKAEVAEETAIQKGGSESIVLIGSNSVLRSGNNDPDKHKRKNNYNYDEAMSRLGEITGLGSQAGARTTYFNDKNGELHYGTLMEKGKADAGQKESYLAFQEDEAGINIFDHGNDEKLERNAKIILSSYKMQILDYIGLHTDRKADNFMINLESKDYENVFMGIDNDNVFGLSPGQSNSSYQMQARGQFGVKQQKENDETNYSDGVSTLKGFHILPENTAKQIADLDEKKIEQGMKPYMDRATRFALMRRIRKLKKTAANAEVIDIFTIQGMKEFQKKTMKEAIYDLVELTNMFDMNTLFASTQIRSLPSVLMRTIMSQSFLYGNLGKSAEQKMEIFRQMLKTAGIEEEEIAKLVNEDVRKRLFTTTT